MSVHKLTGRDGVRYLTRQVAAGDVPLEPGASLTAYYDQTGNPPGRWYGSGLAGLGDGTSHKLLPGAPVSEDAMLAVFGKGHDPLTGEPLGRPFPQHTQPSPTADGAATASRRPAPRAVVGFDLTFTAPKSVSVLWALADDATRQKIHAAHRAALASALEFVEAKVVRTRVGAGGRRQIRTNGMLAAAFEHFDTRAGDPNLHTHVVIANKTQGPDGQWRSLDGKTVLAAAVTVSEFYDTVLADELTRRLPLEWEMRDRGERRNPAFEITGIGEDLLAEFSTRSGQIHDAELTWAADFHSTHGRAPSRTETIRARQHFTVATRPPKTLHRLSDLFTEWANRARVLTGLAPRDLATRALRGQYGRALRARDVGPEVRAALVAQTIADVSERRSVWTTWNLGAAALRSSKLLRMADPAERRTLLNDITGAAAKTCIQLDDTRDPESRRMGEELYTSVELLEAEKVLLDAAETTGAPRRTSYDLQRPDVQRSMARLEGLAADQRAAVEAILTSGLVLDALVGAAGSGKTTTMAALTSCWTRNIGPVVGLAPSASAAHTLTKALDAPCETTAKWLWESTGTGAATRAVAFARLEELKPAATSYGELERIRRAQERLRADQDQWHLTPGQLVIVDEASLADTRTLAALVTQAEAAQTKVLLVGDHLQRGSVDAGGAFGMLARRGPTAELTTLWRFTHAWEARASLELRHAQPTALDAYQAHGAISTGTSEQMLSDSLAAATTARENGRVAILQAVDNRTVNALNARAHADGVLAGTITGRGVTLGDGLTAGVGDRIVTRRNNRRLRTPDGYVRNGSFWDITAVLPGGAILARPAPQGGTGSPDQPSVRLPASYVRVHVDLGYATTTARTQGMTVDETHTIAAAGMGREDLYVAMSRGSDLNRVYVLTDTHDDDCVPRAGEAPSGRNVLDQILATSHVELTATETWAANHPDAPVPILATRASSEPGLSRSTHRLSQPTPVPVRDGPVLGI
ncbi:MobF family relaxase [Pengzhenrongella sicca]|uniref:Relaxase domain-containing protein n=1 Tax=Pengzhenrongella sicca TaxID=2819238 RepID=A0A8A4ZIB0_9MICO|nr:MobF family relaxase [Pengzhenrongella sicca]QTE29348.1 relaxase domain-containing protein [Pengzhenrongella sicca]